MDPVTTLGLALSVLQLVSWSHGLLSSAREIAASSAGMSKEVKQLKLLVEDVQQSSRDFAKLVPTQRNQNLLLLRGIAAECNIVAETLLEKLSKLEARRDGFARRIEAFGIAARYSWSKDEICSLTRRLFELEARLRQWWQAETQSLNHSSLGGKIDDLACKMTEVNGQSPRHQLVELQRDVSRSVDLLTTLCNSCTQRSEETTSKKEAKQLNDLTTAHTAALKDTMAALAKMSSGLGTLERQEAIIRSLSFSALRRRHNDIPLAHRETLKWIYDKGTTSFKNWLEDGKGIFWVSGLAGSGKSTLMKFVSDGQQTREILESWAAPMKPCIASHYFWNAGDEMERCQIGLLQSLLFQIFRYSHSLCGTLCPERSVADPWDICELRAAFERLSRQTDLDIKFCFFIDGLDEFDGAEEDMIQLVKELAASEHIKVCVSSRPWPAFLAEWNPSDHNLKVQDLTKNDMDNYIRELLVENKHFGKMARADSRYYDLIPRISARAEGVWLWVFLVVRDLLRDMRDKEPYDQLVIRLQSYPQELDKFYEDMMNRIDKVYQTESAQIMLLALKGVLDILTLPNLARWSDPDLTATVPTAPITSGEMDTLYEEWVPGLQNRCRDLMQIRRDETYHGVLVYRIDFLHRTVRDFLEDKYRTTLRQRAPDGFDESFLLGRMIIRRMKRSNRENYLGMLALGLQFLDATQDFWRQDRQYASSAQVALMDDFEQALKSWGKQQSSVDSPPILPWVVFYGMHLYLKHSLEKDPNNIHIHDGRPLLDRALHTCCNGDHPNQDDFSKIDGRVVFLLLEYKADPNELIKGRVFDAERTPFLGFVRMCSRNWSKMSSISRDESTPSQQETVFRLLKILLEHGADPMIKSLPVAGDGEAAVEEQSVTEYLAPLLGPTRTAELQSIVEPLLAAKRVNNDGLVSRIWRWVGY